MALTSIPGQVGYRAHRYSSLDGKAIGRFTDKNHLETLAPHKSPTPYDRGIIDIYTQTSQESNDFIDMINKSEPFYIDGDTWSWKIARPYEFTKIIEIPDTTLNNPTPGIDGQKFEVVFNDNYFSINDTITSNRMYGDRLTIVGGPTPYNAGYLYEVVLTGAHVTASTSVDRRALAIGTEYDKMDNSTGEFDQELSGLNKLGGTIDMYQSISAGYGVQHTITKWADNTMLRDSKGRPLDIIVYDQYRRNEKGEEVYMGSRWEPYIEHLMKLEMLKIRKNRILWGSGGELQTLGHRQENKNLTEGIVSQIRNYGNKIEFNKGDFNLNMIRDMFGDLFYRRVAMKNRRVKLYTNEAGIRLFREANKDDLMNAGFTIIADNRFIQGEGQNMIVNYGFSEAFTMETGRIEVAHLMELDLPQMNSEFGPNKYSTPIFMAFDISDPDGSGTLKNIREVRKKGAPSMTWGYVDGRMSHLGHAASQGMNSASMLPGYQIWMEDHCDVFIEDLSRCVIMEQIPQF